MRNMVPQLDSTLYLCDKSMFLYEITLTLKLAIQTANTVISQTEYLSQNKKYLEY